MNVERLHAILKVVNSEITTSKSADLLGSLVDALQNQVNQPQDPRHQQQVSENVKKLRNQLTGVPSNTFSPGWKLTLNEIGAAKLLGNALIETIDEIFARNQITVSVALDEIKTLRDSHKKLHSAIVKALESLSHFGIGSEALEPGEAEVGILIPRSAVKNSLSAFGDELEELDKTLNVFSEIANQERPPLQIRTISSSEFQVFLESASSIAACIAFSIERVVALYEKLLNVRRLRMELQNEDVPEENLKGVSSHANGLMSTGIDALANEILEEFYEGTDSGRRNEIKVELKYSLKKIANRIDRGYNIEVRAEPSLEEDSAEGDTDDPDRARREEQIKIIRDASVRLRYRKMEGDPILSLPESDDEAKKQ